MFICISFLGTPFFHSMIAKSRSFTSEISVIVDPETVILSGFISTLSHAHELDHDWLLVASSQNVSYFPFHLDKSEKHWLADNGQHVKIQEVWKSSKANPDGAHCVLYFIYLLIFLVNGRSINLFKGLRESAHYKHLYNSLPHTQFLCSA